MTVVSTGQGGFTDFFNCYRGKHIAVSPTNSDSILINIQNSNNYYSHGIYRSIDGGDNWVESNFNPSTINDAGLGNQFIIYTIKYHPTAPNLFL